MGSLEILPLRNKFINILVCYSSLSYREVILYFQIFTKYGIICFSVVQSRPTLCDLVDLMNCSAPGFTSFTIPWSLLKIICIQSVMPCNHLVLCHPRLLPSIFCSIRIFSNGSALCIRWPKYWSFSFSISCCSEYSGLIYFRTDWFDLLAVQGTLKSFLQHRSSKASILQHSILFIVQLSHPYMTTGKTIALT